MHDTLKYHKVKVFPATKNPIRSQKIRPNDPCPCGSGKKAKNCCGTESRFYRLKKDAE